MKTPSHHSNGSALVAALVSLAVLTLIAASTFETVTSRFRSNYQTASWHDALTAAESGVELSLARLRNPLNTAGLVTDPLSIPGSLQADLATLTTGGTSTNGTVLTWTNNGITYPRIQLPTLTIAHAGEGSSQLKSSVTIDALPMANLSNSGLNTWYRIRSTGIVPLSGRASVGIQKYDNYLRKLQFHFDSAGLPLSKPQAVRTVEVLAKPVTVGSSALFGKTGIDLNNQNVVVDSYDSGNPLYSTNGLYVAAKAQQQGNIVTDDNAQSNGSPGVINLSPTGAQVNGNISTNNTPVTGSAGHVTGTITQDFYQALPNAPNPALVTNSWSSLSSSATSVATGTVAAPTRYKVSGSGSISLTGGSSLSVTAPASGTGYVEIWIPGDLTISGNGGINIPANVHAIFYVDGAVKISGNGIFNTSLLPGNVTLYGNHDPTVAQSMTVDGNGQFAGMIYAPNASVTVKGGGNSGDIYGSIFANSIFFNGVTSLHYDHAQATAGAVIDYHIASWYEDNTLTR